MPKRDAVSGFAIAKPPGLSHRAGVMLKPFCCLVPVLGLAACVPPKAELVQEVPAAPERPKPVVEAAGNPEPDVNAVQESGMRIPVDRLVGKLPEKRDMTATVAPASGGGVTASPPAPGAAD